MAQVVAIIAPFEPDSPSALLHLIPLQLVEPHSIPPPKNKIGWCIPASIISLPLGNHVNCKIHRLDEGEIVLWKSTNGVAALRFSSSFQHPNYENKSVQDAIWHPAPVDMIEWCNEAKDDHCCATKDPRSCSCPVHSVLQSCEHVFLCREGSQWYDICPIRRIPTPQIGNRLWCVEVGFISQANVSMDENSGREGFLPSICQWESDGVAMNLSSTTVLRHLKELFLLDHVNYMIANCGIDVPFREFPSPWTSELQFINCCIGILMKLQQELGVKLVLDQVWVLWWTALSVPSSIGLGSGLHTLVQHLKPHIAQFTIKGHQSADVWPSSQPRCIFTLAIQCGQSNVKLVLYNTIQLNHGPSWLDEGCSNIRPPLFNALHGTTLEAAAAH